MILNVRIVGLILICSLLMFGVAMLFSGWMQIDRLVVSEVLLGGVTAAFIISSWDMAARGKLKAKGAKKRRKRVLPFIYNK
jgi:hypothetical protein